MSFQRSGVLDQLNTSEDMVIKYLDNADLQQLVLAAYLPMIQNRAKLAWQEHVAIAGLLGPDKESATLEYKSTLRTAKDSGEVVKVLETSCLKTIAAFMNSREGGTLLIGVADDGTVHGLDTDYASLHKADKDDRDRFRLHLGNIVSAALGDAAAANTSVQSHTIEGKDLCRMHVREWISRRGDSVGRSQGTARKGASVLRATRQPNQEARRG